MQNRRMAMPYGGIFSVPQPPVAAAAVFGERPESGGAVKGPGLRRVIRSQLDLAHIRVPRQQLPQKRRADAPPLVGRADQQVLDEHNGLAVPHRPEQPDQSAVCVGRKS